MSTEKRVDFSGLVTADLKQAGLAVKDIELSIQFAHVVSEAVKLRRAKLREDSAALSSEQEKAEDDQLFLGAVTLLAQKMKPTKR
jgi:hypothetical protein